MVRLIACCVFAGIWALAASAEGAVVGSPYANSVLADQPMVYYGFDETGGAVAVDTSGHGYAGTYAGAGYTLGQPAAYPALGTAVAFPGTDGPDAGRVAVPDLSTGTVTAFTVEFWVRLNSRRNQQAYYHTNGWQAGALHLFGTSGTNAFCLQSNTPTDANLDDNTQGQWHHLVFTYDTATGQVMQYLDAGSPQTYTFVSSAGVPFDPATIGAWYWDGGGQWIRSLDGAMDEFAVYNKVLSASEVQAHFDAASVPEPGLTTLLVLGGLVGLKRRKLR